jgi:hypothetical protein
MTTRIIGLWVGLAACDPVAPGDASPEDAPPEDASLTSESAADLRFLREEEKLARDVYGALGDRHGTPTFINIGTSEQRHMDALGAQIERLGLEDPITDDTRGIFVDPTLAALYDDLVADGGADLVAALIVGATIEDLDLVDIDQAIAGAGEETLASVYASLACGSRNHLRAFTGQLASRGVPYAPQYLDDDAYAAIVNAPHESCGGG